MTATMDKELAEALSGKAIDPFVLKTLEYEWPVSGKPQRLDATFLYLGMKDGLPLLTEFCHQLKKSIVDFCLPRSELLAAKKEYEKNGDESVFYRLHDKARQLFIKAISETKRSGEGGELILFNLLEKMGAPQLVSKMYLKTASQMPVYGSDGLHIGPASDDFELTIYIGESKLHAEYDNALGDALKSVTELVGDAEKYQREFELLTDHFDHKLFSPEFEASLRDYLDPYSPKVVKRKEVHACLIGFDFIEYDEVSGLASEAEEAIVEKAKAHAEAKLKNLTERIKKDKYKNLNLLFFFLPVPSVESFRQHFNQIVLGVK